MKSSLKIAVSVALLVFLSSVILPCWGQTSWSHTSPTEQTAKNTYQAFLTNVMSVDLAKYTINQSGYGVSNPPKWGGTVREETLSYTLVSGQGTVDTWCNIDNGIITVVSLYSTTKGGSIIYTQPPANNAIDAARNFLQKYQSFISQFYPHDTTYLVRAMSSLDGVNGETPLDKIDGNMELTLSISSYYTRILWTYVQDGAKISTNNVNFKISNNSITWFADSWNRYSVSSNQTIISEEEAESFAFDEIKDYNLTLASFQGSTVTPVQVQPDWTNMRYEANLGWANGAAQNATFAPGDSVYPSNVARDPLTLYPMWHFIFYFGKPIGNTIGLEVTVWGDTKELADCHAYGYLGDGSLGDLSYSAPQQTNGQSSNTSTQTPNQTTLPLTLPIGVTIAVAVVMVTGLLVYFKKCRRGLVAV